MKRIILALLTALSLTHTKASDVIPKDTTRVIDIEEVVVIASPKETAKLRQLPGSVSLISQKQMQENRICSMKDISSLVPNFFMPDYGSRLTSAIYIRGIGARINTPAVGLYVDNVPYIDKSAFDFNFYDIERIDILRGPQGTLYGRNTMGGLIKVHTRSPFDYQGTDLKLGIEGQSSHYTASLTHYHRVGNKFAFSAGGFYENAKGFFRNEYLNKMADPLQAGGGRIRAIYLPEDNLKIDFTLGYEYSDQGGYAYGLYDKETGKIAPVAYNDESSYRRGLLNGGLNIEYQARNFILSAVTGYQNLNDRMFIDQDFTSANIYTIEQKQKLNIITEEIVLKSKPGKNWQWTTGAFGAYQWLHTDGPVTFKEDGVKNMIEGKVNDIFASLPPSVPQMSMEILSREILVSGVFDTPVLTAAAYHQSTYNNLFVKGLSVTAGLRLDYEKTSMSYQSGTDFNFNFNMKMGNMPLPSFNDLNASPMLEGKEANDYLQLLPKFAVKYDFNPRNNIYVSASKGYRSGGYNIQMFSDLIMGDTRNSVYDALIKKMPNMAGMIEKMPGYGEHPDVNATTIYKPEYSWNYEVGTHLLLGGILSADLSVFYMDTRDQQVALFAPSGLGRMTVNAGKSRSIGTEAAFNIHPVQALDLNVSYGFTRATFVDYQSNEVIDGKLVDMNYNGNYVPMVPRHTLCAGGSYTFKLKNKTLDRIVLGLTYAGAGKMYWTEKNNIAQDFYGTLAARASFRVRGMQVDFWGRNLLNKEYTAFYFESMGNSFMQKGKPLQLGIDVRCSF